MPIQPLTPKTVVKTLPEFVICAINNVIQENYQQGYFKVKQDLFVDEILKCAPEELQVTRSTIFEKHWLDFEDIYRKAGWYVEFDKPGWDESYDAFFKFKG